MRLQRYALDVGPCYGGETSPGQHAPRSAIANLRRVARWRLDFANPVRYTTVSVGRSRMRTVTWCANCAQRDSRRLLKREATQVRQDGSAHQLRARAVLHPWELAGTTGFVPRRSPQALADRRRVARPLVSDAPAGHFSEELDNLLHVGTQDVLRKLVQERKLSRRKLAGQFLYCAADRTRKAQQLSARRALLAADLMPDELRAAIVLFASLLDERQRRLYAGLESLKCGWGGDARIAGLLGIDPGTVARGRKQLLAQDVERARVRRPGGGRPPLEKKLPR